jgi:hypothetical protein
MPAGLVILRDEQLRQIGAALFDRYFEQVMAHLREVFPLRLRAMGDDAARALARHSLERGRWYGLTRERNLTLFVDLFFALGSRWEESEGAQWLRDLLQDRSRSEDARMWLVYRRLPGRYPESGDGPELP